MSVKTLCWGVISTANIGRAAMIPALKGAANGELVAVCSRELGRAREFADRLDIPRAYGSYEALLADGEIDAVYIPLPNKLHREWCLRAAEAGKHILCEKPLALNAAEVADMAAAARKHGVLLMESFMYRFHPQTERVLALLEAGAIGDVRLIKSAFSFRVTDPANVRWSAELGGGSLMDVGCYCVNASRTLAAGEPVEVQAFATWADSGVDAQMVGQLRFENGLYAQFDSALTLARREFYQVVGTEGVIDVAPAFLPGRGDTHIRITRGRGEVQTETIPGCDEYQAIAEHFADCVIHGKLPRYPVEEAAANMRVIEALFRSARNGGRPESL